MVVINLNSFEVNKTDNTYINDQGKNTIFLPLYKKGSSYSFLKEEGSQAVNYAFYPLSKNQKYFQSHKKPFDEYISFGRLFTDDYTNHYFRQIQNEGFAKYKNTITRVIANGVFCDNKGKRIEFTPESNNSLRYLYISDEDKEFIFNSPLVDVEINLYEHNKKYILTKFKCPELDTSSIELTSSGQLKEILIGKDDDLTLNGVGNFPILPKIEYRKALNEISLKNFREPKSLDFITNQFIRLEDINVSKGIKAECGNTFSATYVNAGGDLEAKAEIIQLSNVDIKGKINLDCVECSLYAGSDFSYCSVIDKLRTTNLTLQQHYTLIDTLIIPKGETLTITDSASRKAVFVNNIICDDEQKVLNWQGGKGVKIVFRGAVQPSHKVYITNDPGTIYTRKDIKSFEELCWYKLNIMG